MLPVCMVTNSSDLCTMKNYTMNFSGGYTETWHDRIYGTIPVDGSRYTAVQNVIQNDLSGVSSAVGNFKTPNPQAYNHLSSDGQYISYTEFRVLDDGRTYNYSKSGSSASTLSFFSFTDPGAYNSCVAKLGEFIRGSLDLSIDTFQGKQTIALAKRLLSVRKIVTYLVESTIKDESLMRRRRSTVVRNRVYAIKRSRKDNFAVRQKLFHNPMKEVGSLWLEFQYGLRPTLQSIHDLVSGEADRAGNHMTIKSPSGRLGVQAQQQEEKKVVSKGSWYTDTSVYRTTFRYKMGGTYLPSSSHLESLSRLSSLNPANILWELLPFSFVIDWFIDVGGTLRSIETAMISNLGTFQGYQTFTKRDFVSNVQSFNGVVNSITRIGSITDSKTRTSKSRVKLTSVPYPRRPRFGANLGSGRLLNAAALLSQVLTSGVKR